MCPHGGTGMKCKMYKSKKAHSLSIRKRLHKNLIVATIFHHSLRACVYVCVRVYMHVSVHVCVCTCMCVCVWGGSRPKLRAADLPLGLFPSLFPFAYTPIPSVYEPVLSWLDPFHSLELLTVLDSQLHDLFLCCPFLKINFKPGSQQPVLVCRLLSWQWVSVSG